MDGVSGSLGKRGGGWGSFSGEVKKVIDESGVMGESDRQ